MAYTHNAILLGYDKRCYLTIWSNLNGIGGYYAIWSESQRKRQRTDDLTHLVIERKKNNKGLGNPEHSKVLGSGSGMIVKGSWYCGIEEALHGVEALQKIKQWYWYYSKKTF